MDPGGACWQLPRGLDLSRCAVEEHHDELDSEQRLDYATLLAAAARLAAAVTGAAGETGCLADPGADVCVALLCEGAAYVVAFFALARAGFVTVPLNPHDPPARLRVVVEDAGVGVAAVNGEAADLRAALPELRFVEALASAEEGADVPAAPARALATGAAALCYLIYTSGSTGRPKGVAVEHRQLRMYCDALNRKTGLGAESRMLVPTAVNWDPCLSDVMRTLIVGGAVIFEDRDRLFQNLQGELIRLGVTHLFATPSWWSLLEGAVDVCGTCGGEPFRPPLARLVPRVRNLYGVTEGTVAQTLGPEGGSIHVGWAIDPEAARVELNADPEREHEIVMVGPQVARGYWRGEAFNGSFATGDRGSFDAEGALHVLGRIDHQVKVRGHRVELGEVEAVLRGVEGVRDAVVVLHGLSLVALCEGEEAAGGEDIALAPAAWSAEVARALPAPFRPAPLFVGKLPRLPNGKANRQQVAAVISAELDGRSGAGGAPRAGTEQLIAELWEDVLPVSDKVGRDDNWFALGGTSLGAVQLLRRLPNALAAAGLRVDRKVAWCGLHRHPSLQAYASFLDWASAAPKAALADPVLLDMGHPLAAAAGRGEVAACQELVRGGGANGYWRPDSPCETPLHAAARHGHVEVVDLLVESRAKLTAGTKAQLLPLHLASQLGHCEVAERLLEAGTPVDARDWNRWSAVFFAIVGGAGAVVELLIGRGCTLNVRDRWGRTTLSWACEKGREEVVRQLLGAKAACGARLQARAADKWQADWRPEAHYASAHPACLALLLAARASLGCTDLHGRSPLHAAVSAGSADSARLLLEAGCRPSQAVLALALEDDRFGFLTQTIPPSLGTPEKAFHPESLLFDIPPWQPAEVKRAVRAACGRARVRVASSGQAGVCLGTAVVESHLDCESLRLTCTGGEAMVGVTSASQQDLSDQAFPRAPVHVRNEVRLEGPLPPRVSELASALAALAAGSRPSAEGADGWTWQDWSAQGVSPTAPAVALVDPGALGLQLIYEGVPFVLRRAGEEWRRSAEVLCRWRMDGGLPSDASQCGGSLVVGLASAGDLAEEGGACVLWATEWPWPEAEIELPCPGGVLLVNPGPAGALGLALARAWHAAQPWRGSRTAAKLWKGGSMGSQ